MCYVLHAPHPWCLAPPFGGIAVDVLKPSPRSCSRDAELPRGMQQMNNIAVASGASSLIGPLCFPGTPTNLLAWVLRH